MELNERKIIARRAALELNANSVVNLGIGMPEGVANVSSEERITDLMTLTAEPGVIGGIPAGGLNFGQPSMRRPSSISRISSISTTVADLTRLWSRPGRSARQSERQQVRPCLAGAGAHQHQPERQKVIFVGTFTAGRLSIAIDDGRLRIVKTAI